MTEFNTSKQVHNFSRNNKELINKSDKCGCFYCLKIFTANKVQNYIGKNKVDGVCPFCSIDSLIPDKSGVELSDEFLKVMRRHWFNI